MKKLLSTIALGAALLFSKPAKAEDIPGVCHEQPELPSHINCENPTIDEMAAVMGINVGLGAAMGCIGSEITGDGCLEGIAKGASGGLITFMGMELGSYNREIPFSGAAGRLINDLGASMVANAIFSRGAFERYETTIGPVLFSFDSNAGFNAALMPISLAGVSYYIFSGNSFDPLASIEDFNLVFYSEKEILIPMATLEYTGFTWVNIPAYTRASRSSRSHENLHTYQLSRLRWIDELVPQIEGLRYGAELANTAIVSYPSLFGTQSYYYHPYELEAYSMSRE